MNRRRHALLASVALVSSLVAPLSCGGGDADRPTPTIPRPRAGLPDAVYVEGSTFRDGLGRQLLFRGYNVKVNGIFDVQFPDGRAPNYTFPDFDEAGAQRFEELGYSVVRLCINWSALEPSPRVYSKDFFAKVDHLLAMAKAHHFRVFFDFHQDAYSKEIGEDGAPLWAIVPAPDHVLAGPSDDSRRLSFQVLDAGESFWNDAATADGRTLQAAFVEATQALIGRYAGDPTLMGLETWNEPIAANLDLLYAFHRRVADAVHRLDADLPVFFEPNASRNQWDFSDVPTTPWSNGPGVYAPHVYTGWFSIPSQNGWESQDPAKLLPSMQSAVNEAAAWKTPLFVTEFGCDHTVARGLAWISAELDLQDRFLASSTLWGWEPGSWSPRDDAGVQGRPASMRVISRSYPRAVAGDLLAIERPAAGTMRVRYLAAARAKGAPHEVGASIESVRDWKVTCDGVEVPVLRATGRGSFTCPADGDGAEHVFELVGTALP